jgi:hypothetical protein
LFGLRPFCPTVVNFQQLNWVACESYRSSQSSRRSLPSF